MDFASKWMRQILKKEAFNMDDLEERKNLDLGGW